MKTNGNRKNPIVRGITEVNTLVNHRWIRLKYITAERLEKAGNYTSVTRARIYLVICCITALPLMAILILNITVKDLPRIYYIPKATKIHSGLSTQPILDKHDDPLRLKFITARKYLDSLQNDSTGRILYDSIVKRHPGLLDSLRKAEDYYSK